VIVVLAAFAVDSRVRVVEGEGAAHSPARSGRGKRDSRHETDERTRVRPPWGIRNALREKEEERTWGRRRPARALARLCSLPARGGPVLRAPPPPPCLARLARDSYEVRQARVKWALPSTLRVRARSTGRPSTSLLALASAARLAAAHRWFSLSPSLSSLLFDLAEEEEEAAGPLGESLWEWRE